MNHPYRRLWIIPKERSHDRSEMVLQAPEVSRFIAGTSPGDLSASSLSDRARGVLPGLAVGNLLGLPVEGDRYDWITESYPDVLTDIDPREANRLADDDLAQAVDLGESLLAMSCSYPSGADA